MCDVFVLTLYISSKSKQQWPSLSQKSIQLKPTILDQAPLRKEALVLGLVGDTNNKGRQVMDFWSPKGLCVTQ